MIPRSLKWRSTLAALVSVVVARSFGDQLEHFQFAWGEKVKVAAAALEAVGGSLKRPISPSGPCKGLSLRILVAVLT